MDMRYLLLGRPYQYDRNIIYDKRFNMYSLNIKKKYIMLAPRRDGQLLRVRVKIFIFIIVYREEKEEEEYEES